MIRYKWHLRKGSKKDVCPQCGQRRFVPFVDDDGQPAGATFGRCDRENSCGYFKYPSNNCTPAVVRQVEVKPLPPLLLQADILQWQQVTGANTLFQAFAPLVGADQLMAAMTAYHCGTGQAGECIFFQYDGNYIRTAKMMKYDVAGHRVKDDDGMPLVRWLHKYIHNAAHYELRQCLFGEHLLAKAANVYVVEAEKTAILMSATWKEDAVWVACGGSNMLNGAINLMPLMGKEVTLIPDDGQWVKWQRIARLYGWQMWNFAEICPQIAATLPDGADIWDLQEKIIQNARK